MNTTVHAEADLGLVWRNRFAGLGAAFYTPLLPTPLPSPTWVGISHGVARLVGLDDAWLTSPTGLNAFTGNVPIAGSQPLASVYSGHQFGHWAGQLGDGRAILLGEVDTGARPAGNPAQGRGPHALLPHGRRPGRAAQLASANSSAARPCTRWAYRPAARCASPARPHRCGAKRSKPRRWSRAWRPASSASAISSISRTAASTTSCALLADFVIDHFYPACREAPGNPYAALLEAVSERTAEMVAQWQAVGFCHGVMNTDNMSILGLTIDYGPFQFLDAFDPGHICNHSDTGGRYAYNRQPNIAYWNLFALGQALLPLMDEQQQALDALEPYKALMPAALQRRMNAKLGLASVQDGDAELTEALMKLMAADAVDFTIFWRRLSHAVAGGLEPVRDLFLQRDAFDAWAGQWQARLQAQPGFDATATQAHMLRTNPHVVLRNHLGEVAIQRAKQGDFSEVARLQNALEHPFEEVAGQEDLAAFPPDWASQIEISCSS